MGLEQPVIHTCHRLFFRVFYTITCCNIYVSKLVIRLTQIILCYCDVQRWTLATRGGYMNQVKGILERILLFCERALGFIHNVPHEAFISNMEKQYAVCMALLQVGEMIGLLPDQYKAQHPRIRWRQIKATCNMITYAHDSLDTELLWQTMSTDIHLLIQDIRQLLDDMNL